jgi:phage-related protein
MTDMRRFKTVFTEEVDDFLSELDSKVKAKILFNIEKAELDNDPRLFKKLNKYIWEFRTKYGNLQYRFCFLGQTREPKYFGYLYAWHGKKD